MIDWLVKQTEEAVGNTLNIAGNLLEGELPSKSQLSKLIADGFTVVTIASAAGLAENIIEEILKGDE